MFNYFKQFATTLIGGFLLGITLAIFAGIPWLSVVSLAVSLLILKIGIELYKSQGAVIGLFKELALFVAGVALFVGLRIVVGYYSGMQISQTYNDLFSTSLNPSKLATEVIFELLFLGSGVGFTYLVIKKGAFWKAVLVALCTILLFGQVWSIKQRPHAEAMKRQTQALVSLNARGLNNKALVNEAAAATSFGIAKEQVSVWYRWDGTNIIWDQAMTNVVLQGQRVLQPHPNDGPVITDGQAFTQVVLQNTNGSFVGGTKVWVETWHFNWVDGKNAITPPVVAPSTFTVNQGEVISTLPVPDHSTVFIEADKAFCIFEGYGTNPDGSQNLSKLTFPPGKSKKYFAGGGTLRVIGLYTNTTVKLHL